MKYIYLKRSERMAHRLKAVGVPNYANGFEVTLHEELLKLPLKWRKPKIIFVNSMSDLFHEKIPVREMPEVAVPTDRAYPLADSFFIIGYPYVPITPFLFKDYEKWDDVRYPEVPVDPAELESAMINRPPLSEENYAMKNIYFTADTHFNHANIISFCQRPFASVAEMNEALIAKWNARVGEGDLVYHLGDFAWGDWGPILERLNGDIFLISGGHDKKVQKKYAGRFLHTADLMDIVIEEYAVVLCHYCLRVWNKSHFDSWHLFGHSHGQLPALGKSLDVGVDGHGFAPWAWGEIKVYMAERPHNENFLGSGKKGDGRN